MDMAIGKLRFSLLAVLSGALLLLATHPLIANADYHADYLSGLQIAQGKVDRTSRAGAQAAGTALTGPRPSSLAQQLMGHTYRVGDRWKVAAWITHSTGMRATSEPEALAHPSGQGGIFQYEVVAPNQIEVTQLEELGWGKVDSRVSSLKLSTTDHLGLTRKEYRVSGREKPFVASPEGVHVPVSYLELFPLEVPDVETAIRRDDQTVPELPAPLQAVAQKAGFALDAAHAIHFEQDDFFGREVESFWEPGKPWPSLIQTANGVAILLENGGSR
jgi:hypothetical protein